MPTRKRVREMLDLDIYSYDKEVADRSPPPTPVAVGYRKWRQAYAAMGASLCLAWLDDDDEAGRYLRRAANHFYELFDIGTRHEDEAVRRQGRVGLNTAREGLCSLALAGSPEQLQDVRTLLAGLNEKQSDDNPALRFFVCALRDLLAGEEEESRRWVTTLRNQRRIGKRWIGFVQGAEACLAIVERDTSAFAVALEGVLANHRRLARGELRRNPKGLRSLRGTALVALAHQHGMTVDLSIPNGEYIAQCFLAQAT